jgi:opacity protein-like surface antigen
MKRLLILAGCAVLLTGCGGASDVSKLVVSTPDNAALAVAEANVQDGNTAMAGYFATNGSYAGATTTSLRTMQPGLSPTVGVAATADGYCIQSVVDGVTASVRGPGSAAPGPGAC